MPAYLISALVFLAAIVVFIFQNHNPVAVVHFLNWHSPKISMSEVALIAAVCGAFITFLIDSVRAFKTGKKLRELTNKNKKLEKEIASLKPNKLSSKESTAQSGAKDITAADKPDQ